MRNCCWESKTREGDAWEERAKAIVRPKSRCKGIREEKPNLFQEGPIGWECPVRSGVSGGPQVLMGLLKPSPRTLENHLDFFLRAMESQHLSGLE